jgi:hypothetical protein
MQETCGPAADQEPCCIECFDLRLCSVLNTYQIETSTGGCSELESRVERLDIFGPSRTFRDTAECRDLVYDYVCHWWGSDNPMYTNRCGSRGQVPPCRSFCVQVAELCANNEDYVHLCEPIDCPPTADTCKPGPYEQPQSEKCLFYYFHHN